MTDYIDAMFDKEKADQLAKEGKTEVLLEALNELRRDHEYLDGQMDRFDGWAYEIASSTPGPPDTHRGSSMSSYWRWNLWEDCRADTPDQIERLMQALVGAAFDNARLQAELSETRARLAARELFRATPEDFGQAARKALTSKAD